MSKFVLEPMYLTKLSGVDDQHKGLVTLMNQVFDLIEQKAPAAKQLPVLEKLGAATKAHFAYEEGEMKAASYGDFEKHKAAHERLLGQLTHLVSDAKAGKPLGSETTDFLTVWLSSHILGQDQRYVPDMKKHGRGELKKTA